MVVRFRYSNSNPRRSSTPPSAVKAGPDRWQSPSTYEIAPAPEPEPLPASTLLKAAPIDTPQPPPAQAAPAAEATSVSPSEMVQGLSHILNPASAVALAFGIWRLGSDMGFAREFVLTEGPFAHWQFWAVLAGALQFLGASLRSKFRSTDDDSQAAA